MEHVRLGTSGLLVSRLCLGTLNFGGRTPEDASLAILGRALEDGVTFWDTANMYNEGRTEEIVGRALKLFGARDRVVLATKAGQPVGPGPNDRGGSRRHLLQQVDGSLRRLQTDWIDLFHLHRADFGTPLEETIETLQACVQAGKVRYWGSGLFPSWRMAEAVWRSERRGWARPVSEQAAYNLLDRRIEIERLPYLRDTGWALLPASPLAGGVLSGRYALDALDHPPPGSRLSESDILHSRITPRALSVAAELTGLARELGLSLVHLATAWLLRQPGVTAPIIGPATMDQYRESLGALEVRLPDDALARIDELVPPGSAVADFHSTAGWFAGSLLGPRR